MSPADDELSQPMPRIKRRGQRNERFDWHRLIRVGAMAGAVLVLWSQSHPGFALLTGAFGSLLCLLAAGGWVASLFVGERARGLKLLVVPAVAVVTGALLFFDAPLRARWSFSESAFGREVRKLPSPLPGFEGGPMGVHVPDRIGLFSIDDAYRYDNAVLFYDEVGSFTDSAGFAYLPDGLPARLDDGTLKLTRLGGSWYAFVEEYSLE